MNEKVSVNNAVIRQLRGISQFIIVLAIISTSLVYGPSLLSEYNSINKTTHFIAGSEEFAILLKRKNFTIVPVRQTDKLQRIRSVNLPSDLATLSPSSRRGVFIGLLLSQAIQANEQILQQRRKLIRYILAGKKGETSSARQRAWVAELAARYGKPGLSATELLRYVDIIPASLTLAQAIIESGWGTSRFAVQGNAIFGQHLPAGSTSRYMVSLQGGVKVQAFDSLFVSIRSYMHNLNTSGAYRKFRTIREHQRSEGKIPDGYTLASGLNNYSVKGLAYIETIQAVLERYNLQVFDQIQLDRTTSAVSVKFSRSQTMLNHPLQQSSKRRDNLTADSSNTTLREKLEKDERQTTHYGKL